MSKRLYVGNLPYSVTEEDLNEMFAAWGAASASIPADESGRSRGFGFVDVNDDQADAAVDAMNGHDTNGRALTVNIARPRPERGGDRGGYGNRGGGDRY